MNLDLRIAEVKDNTREELINALATLSENDADFTGENGLEYLWNRVWYINGFSNMEDWECNGEPTLKYESNLNYVCNTVKDIENDIECIEMFLDMWMAKDSYYGEYHYDLLTDSNGITAIVLAYNYGS